MQTFLVDPILPLAIPTGWMVLQGDQHRRPQPLTAGISESRPILMDWLDFAAHIFVLVFKTFSQIMESYVLPSPVVNWIRERFVLHEGERRSIFSFPLPEVS